MGVGSRSPETREVLDAAADTRFVKALQDALRPRDDLTRCAPEGALVEGVARMP